MFAAAAVQQCIVHDVNSFHVHVYDHDLRLKYVVTMVMNGYHGNTVDDY